MTNGGGRDRHVARRRLSQCSRYHYRGALYTYLPRGFLIGGKPRQAFTAFWANPHVGGPYLPTRSIPCAELLSYHRNSVSRGILMGSRAQAAAHGRTGITTADFAAPPPPPPPPPPTPMPAAFRRTGCLLFTGIWAQQCRPHARHKPDGRTLLGCIPCTGTRTHARYGSLGNKLPRGVRCLAGRDGARDAHPHLNLL